MNKFQVNGRGAHTARRAGWRSGLLWILGAFWLAGANLAMAQSEDGIKAAFLFNFAKFIEWPGKAFSGANAPITIGFVGTTAVADTLEQAVKGKNANGRDIAVKRLTGAAGAETCQMVYVADAGQAAAVVGAVKGKPVLTIGEGDAFLGGGGMIAFSMDGAKVVFVVNGGGVNAAELKMDPKLAKVAKAVK